MKIDFGNKNWLNDDICYAYSYRFEETPVFVQKDGYVENQQYGNGIYDYDNISLLTKKKYSAGAKASIRCAFENLGAPLIVIADEMYTDKRGVLRYGDYLEIVLYKKGVNVWKMWMEDEKVSWKKLVGVEFPVSEGDIHTLSTEITPEGLNVEADGHKFFLRIDDLYSTFHLGLDACEGINRFYSFEIEETT